MPIDFLFLEPRLLLFASCTRNNQTQTENLRKLWSLESLRYVLTAMDFSYLRSGKGMFRLLDCAWKSVL
ncbi:hypothetical protein NC653_015365 [Populus alba x Populus x berolinensis]|uniref:Uncharacterized protein n=1 Tax=Populus alba x Populus x berolinensis TaxID=444605 RepID=A0AAD6QKB9_9ROSI|nr:hypothetical protein NC653_015365 [Populus alba x Populus x berolinensis]